MPGENFPGDRIVSLVDELEGLIEEAKTPFGKNAQMKVSTPTSSLTSSMRSA